MRFHPIASAVVALVCLGLTACTNNSPVVSDDTGITEEDPPIVVEEPGDDLRNTATGLSLASNITVGKFLHLEQDEEWGDTIEGMPHMVILKGTATPLEDPRLSCWNAPYGDPNAQLTVDNHVANIRFTFTSAGRATAALVPHDFAGPAERSCVARAARTAQVPAFSEPRLVVTYPVQF
jgi:hypothetical protein